MATRKLKPAAKAKPPVSSSAKSSAASRKSPQLRKDPAFMDHIEAAVAAEYRKAAVRPAAVASLPAATRTPAQPAALPKAAVASVSAKQVAPSAGAKPKAAKPLRVARPQPVATQLKALRDELAGLLPELDAEGLGFLIEQARVHLYNMKVTELEEAARQASAASATRAQQAATKPAGKSGRSAGSSVTTASQNAADLRFEGAASGSVFHLVYRNNWKMFNGEEIKAMLRICALADPVNQLAGRLYRWLLLERKDVFQEIPISSPVDPLMLALVKLIKKTFTIKR